MVRERKEKERRSVYVTPCIVYEVNVSVFFFSIKDFFPSFYFLFPFSFVCWWYYLKDFLILLFVKLKFWKNNMSITYKGNRRGRGNIIAHILLTMDFSSLLIVSFQILIKQNLKVSHLNRPFIFWASITSSFIITP